MVGVKAYLLITLCQSSSSLLLCFCRLMYNTRHAGFNGCLHVEYGGRPEMMSHSFMVQLPICPLSSCFVVSVLVCRLFSFFFISCTFCTISIINK